MAFQNKSFQKKPEIDHYIKQLSQIQNKDDFMKQLNNYEQQQYEPSPRAQNQFQVTQRMQHQPRQQSMFDFQKTQKNNLEGMIQQHNQSVQEQKVKRQERAQSYIPAQVQNQLNVIDPMSFAPSASLIPYYPSEVYLNYIRELNKLFSNYALEPRVVQPDYQDELLARYLGYKRYFEFTLPPSFNSSIPFSCQTPQPEQKAIQPFYPQTQPSQSAQNDLQAMIQNLEQEIQNQQKVGGTDVNLIREKHRQVSDCAFMAQQDLQKKLSDVYYTQQRVQGLEMKLNNYVDPRSYVPVSIEQARQYFTDPYYLVDHPKDPFLYSEQMKVSKNIYDLGGVNNTYRDMQKSLEENELKNIGNNISQPKWFI